MQKSWGTGIGTGYGFALALSSDGSRLAVGNGESVEVKEWDPSSFSTLEAFYEAVDTELQDAPLQGEVLRARHDGHGRRGRGVAGG